MKPRSKILLLSISIGVLTALIGNFVALEIISDVFDIADFNDPALQRYIGRISISFALVLWLSVFVSLYVGRQRDIEAEKKARKEREDIYVHKPTSLVNARWLDHVLVEHKDPLRGGELNIHSVRLYVIAWWPKVLRYFSEQEKNELLNTVVQQELSLQYASGQMGYLGYGVFFCWGECQKRFEGITFLKNIEFQGKSVALSGFEVDIESDWNSYRLAALAQKFEQKIEKGFGATASVIRALPIVSSDAMAAWQAVARGDISFVFQPIHRLADNEIVSFEMLSRLTAEDGTSIPITDEVADIFENSPLSLNFHRVLLAELRKFQEEICAVSGCISTSINIPAPILTHPGFWAALNQEIDAGLRMDLVAFELTERTLPARSAEIEAALKKLKVLGSKIHLDDFGAGQSSIETISNYDFGLVKIDRAFIFSTKWDSSKSGSLVSFLKSYTRSVLAEGIDDTATADVFKAAGVDLVQGFAFSRPLDKQDAVDLLRSEAVN